MSKGAVWTRVVLLLMYPICVHLSVILHKPSLQGVAIAALAAALLYGGLRDYSRLSWAIFLLVLLVMFGAIYVDAAIYLLYVPPIIIPLLVWSVFFRSLLPGREPIVTDIGERARGPLSKKMRRYTRHVTIIWTVLLGMMTIWSVALLFAPEEIWSLFTNFINYMLVGFLFFVEYLIRKRIFQDHDHPNFIQYILIVINANIRKS